MAYSKEYRKKVIAFMSQGHTHEETRQKFKLGNGTICRWKRLLIETGELEKRPTERESPIYPPEKLQTYIDENPQATLREIAAHFGGSITGVSSVIRRKRVNRNNDRRIE
jgi:transposase